MEDTESSTLPCHLWTSPCSTINWIRYSRNRNTLPKSSLLLDLFSKTLKMDRLDTFLLMKIIRLWRGQKLLFPLDDNANLTEKLQKMDTVDLCTRERANKIWKFYKLTNVTVLAALLKDVPMGCKDTVLPEPLLKINNVNCLTFERNTRQTYNDNLCFLEHLLYICMVTKNWRRRLRKFTNFSWITARKEMFQNSKVFIWMIFQKLKTSCNSISSFMTLIL